ncbi:L-type lectin-domain containing receptor kinase IX.1-like [Cryptomeria japonica]|uniref:L-type lectin-domain containing receptor kinase IX.1-like n=1 Tax=Cryptomeria japonica TaxID=3369 RepID=UPI0027DA396C|nr:L-type lectin-domain containing receptor kinase IX.1-like [Cryptomeria japonica]
MGIVLLVFESVSPQNCGWPTDLCCSKSGFCGIGTVYCGDGCLEGPCYSPLLSPPPSTSTFTPSAQSLIPFSSTIILISVLASSFAIFGFVIFILTRWVINNCRGDGKKSDEELNESLRLAVLPATPFAYDDLSAATHNFSEDEKIGEGGFGSVYRGTLPGTNEAVAVKRISPTARQGKKEYISEVIINSQLTHHNLVRFLGWCHRNDDFLLVYELLPNGSLDKYLFGEAEAVLNWDRRYSIACDVASALVYLHEDRHNSVLHRDIKASNVMLDSKFKAKLGDFGIARVVERERGGHTTVLAGTIGYIAPEAVMTGKATRESDVFSFGALALEIACGRRPADRSLIEHNSRVVEWVWHLHGWNRILDAADEKLGGNFNCEEMERLMKVGLLCSHPDPCARPRMEQVVGLLKRGAELPHVPLEYPIAVYGHCSAADITSSSTSTSSSSSL